MKMVKSLLLGAAAGLVAVAGAQAADLPVKAKPVQYVKICSLYGAGFYYMPGTDTCIKIGGWVRAEINFNSNASFAPYTVAVFDRSLNRQNTRSRGIITVDTRSQTEYGTLRSYIAGGFQFTSGVGGQVYAPRAFIQFAGFTAGLAQSFFDFYGAPAYSNQTNVLSSDTGGGGDFVFAYTAQFGNGLSATISLEDPSVRRTTIGGAAPYAGRYWMDVVANLRVDQAWGSAQVMGAVHEVRVNGAGLAFATSDEVGYAVGVGAKFNLPMLGVGDNISAQLTYGKGAMRYVASGIGAGFGVVNNGFIGAGFANDAVVTATGTHLTEGWSIAGGYNHGWNKQWKTSLYGAYGTFEFNTAATTALGALPGDADWTFWQVGSRTVWTPVQNLDLSIDVMYNNLDSAGTATTPAVFGDQDWFQGIFRVQRNFYP